MVVYRNINNQVIETCCRRYINYVFFFAFVYIEGTTKKNEGDMLSYIIIYLDNNEEIIRGR